MTDLPTPIAVEPAAPPSGRGRAAGVLALVAAATLWSLNGPLIKLLVQDGVAGITIASYRSLIGALLFLPLAWPRRRTLRGAARGWPLAAVLCFTGMTASFVIANELAPASSAILLQYTSPIWVFLLAPLLLREHPRRSEGLVLILAMTGIGIIVLGSPPAHLRGLIVALGSGLGYGLVTLTLRGLRRVDARVVTALNALGSGVLLLGPALVWGTPDLGPRQWVLLLVLGIVQFTVPYLLFAWALQRIEAHKASLLLLLEVVLNPIWTWVAVREQPPAAVLQGGVLILAGVAGQMLLAARRQPTAAPPPSVPPE